MLFSPSPVNNPPVIYFNGAVLEWVESFKYLGLFIDCKLVFSHHTKFICNKLSQILGTIYAASPYLNRSSLLTIYQSLAYSTITQSIIIYGKAAPVHTNPIQVLLNKILRIVLRIRTVNYIPTVNTNTMFYSVGFLKFSDIYNYFLMKFIRNALYNDSRLLNKYLISFIPDHTHDTRGLRLIIPRVRLNIEKNSTIFQAIHYFDSASQFLTEPMSDFKFRKYFKNYTLEQYL